MEEFLLVDDDFCGNCSNNLSSTNLTSRNNSSKIYNLDIVVHTVKENQSLSVECEKVSVFTAIKDLLSCQFQTSKTDSVTAEGFNHSDNDHLHSTNKISEHSSNVNVQVPLCLPCSLLLQDLYRSFKLFQSLRDGTSYISKLTHRIQQTFPISADVRHINDADYDHGIQFAEYGNNESEVQTFEDQLGEEINVKVNSSPSATQGIVDAGPMENVILESRNFQSSSLISNNDIPSATDDETNVKTEPEIETISENCFGLTVEMQEKMIHSAISQIAAEKVGPSKLIECEENSRVNLSMSPTRITSDFDPATNSADAEFGRGNNTNDNYYKLLRRSRRFRSKFKSKSKQRLNLKVVSTATPSTSRSSYLSEMESAMLTLPGPGNEAEEEDGNDSDEIKVVYEASSHQRPNSETERGPEKEITIINAYSVEVPSTTEEPKTSKPYVYSSHNRKRNNSASSPKTNNSAQAIRRRGKNTNPNQFITQLKEKVKCSYCSFRSVRKSIVVHERLHTGEKPFACPLTGCSFRAAHSTNVNKHMKTHLEDNQFPCSLCPYRGKALKHLKCHQNIHHPELLLLLPQFN